MPWVTGKGGGTIHVNYALLARQMSSMKQFVHPGPRGLRGLRGPRGGGGSAGAKGAAGKAGLALATIYVASLLTGALTAGLISRFVIRKRSASMLIRK